MEMAPMTPCSPYWSLLDTPPQSSVCCVLCVGCSELQSVLDQLLEVQQTLLLGHKDTRGVVLGRGQDQGVGVATTGSSPHHLDLEEEIESDTADEEADPVIQEEAVPDNNSLLRNNRKRPPKPWVSAVVLLLGNQVMSFHAPPPCPVQCVRGGKREYEGYVSHLQEQLKGYRDNTISKWGSKAHLSSE